ncbi:DedA family protein [Nocardioides lianchengensis]|uniref:Membrane protein DedA, SNARE-associated domain n=1 Tax=Nocardioides lianchengensis TaxID=1045774 RepID=A0A1G6Y2M4_9ACTN|nr:DedA family protein [Nocardioides lianchengensis]NYG13510.1 membrane protein DedA with SNARE-associated domain [Nocardioides lianchengensis]SDD83865.1 membrane protein DedA, SNARE-associated domain [Nocardioides lianchengensis]
MYAAAAEDPDDLTGVAGWAVDVMEGLGGPGAGLLIALENLFPPLPSEIILPLAGFAASRGGFSLTGAILWTTAGSVVGALVLYLLGRSLGRDRVLAMWLRLPLVEQHDFERTEAWFGRHGRKAVFFGRMLPLFRSLISIPAGVDRMPVGQFLLLTTVGSAIWNTTFVLAGYLLGHEWHRVEPVVGWLQWVVIAAVVLFVGRWLVKRLRQRRTA